MSKRTRDMKIKPKMSVLAQFLAISDQKEAEAKLDHYSQLYRTGKPEIDDVSYDSMELHYESKFRVKYTRGHVVGLRGSNKLKISLPREMPSLEKAKKPEILEKWFKKHPTAPSLKDYLVEMEKLDGMGAMFTNNDATGEIIIINHGNGKIGMDWSHLLGYSKHLPKDLKKLKRDMKEAHITEFRVECILTDDDFEAIKLRTDYTNPRNAVFGALNAEEDSLDPTILEQIHCVVVDVFYEDEYYERESKLAPFTLTDRLIAAKNCGMEVVTYRTASKGISYEEASALLVDMREQSPFTMDGVVLGLNHEYFVQNEKRTPVTVLGKKEDLTIDETEAEKLEKPEFAIAFKVDSLFADTTIRDLEMNCTRFGKAFPTIIVDPVWMNANHDRCTGKNMGFIELMGLEPGSRIRLEKSGDIIPNFHLVLEPGPTGKAWLPPQFDEKTKEPIWKWDKNHVNIYYVDEYHPEWQLARVVAFFKTFKTKGLGEGIAETLFKHFSAKTSKRTRYTKDDGLCRLHGPLVEILQCNEFDLLAIHGFKEAKSAKVWKAIQTCKTEVQLARLMEASSLFDEGFGKDRFGKVVKKIPNVVALDMSNSRERNETIDKLNMLGFHVLADQFIEHLPRFQQWLKQFPMIQMDTSSTNGDVPRATFGKDSSGVATLEVKAQVNLPDSICFTGFRDAAWERMIVAAGSKVQSAISGKTNILVVADKSDNSSKLIKAREKGIPILNRQEFAEKYKLTKA